MELNINQIVYVLVFIACLLLAYIFITFICNKAQQYLGGYLGGYAGYANTPNKDELVEQIYNTLLEYVEEVGTSEYIEDYLMTIHDMSSTTAITPSTKAISVKYSKLYQILYDICSKHNYKNKNEFIFFNGIKYMWFLPDDLRALIVGKSKHKYQTFDKYAIKNNLEQLIYPHVAHRELINELVDKLMPLSRSYVKLKKTTIVKLGGVKTKKQVKKQVKSQAKKQKSSTKKANITKTNTPHTNVTTQMAVTVKDLTKEMIEPDIIGFNGVLNEIAEAVKASTAGATTVLTPEQQLRKIDLMSLRWTDPEAVRSFIIRIVPDIKRIIELDSSKYTNVVLEGLKNNLLRDITFEETELARERNRLREELEREKERRIRDELELSSLKRDMNIEAQRKLEKEFEDRKKMQDFARNVQITQGMQKAMDLDNQFMQQNMQQNMQQTTQQNIGQTTQPNPFDIIELHPKSELSADDDIFK